MGELARLVGRDWSNVALGESVVKTGMDPREG